HLSPGLHAARLAQIRSARRKTRRAAPGRNPAAPPAAVDWSFRRWSLGMATENCLARLSQQRALASARLGLSNAPVPYLPHRSAMRLGAAAVRKYRRPANDMSPARPDQPSRHGRDATVHSAALPSLDATTEHRLQPRRPPPNTPRYSESMSFLDPLS